MLWSLVTLMATNAQAQAVLTDRPNIPSAGIAAEGGPGMMWVNPANMAYDPDTRYGFYFARDAQERSPTSFAAVAGVGGVGGGIYTIAHPGGRSDWALDVATSVKLPERLSLGIHGSWHLIADDRNYVAYDLGAAWRPLPWLGVGLVARNISSPSPLAKASSGGGLALRPFGQALTLGADYLHTFAGDDSTDVLTGTLRFRPVRGVFLRANIDSQLAFGAGLEMFFGKWGGGINTTIHDGDAGFIGFVGTEDAGEAVVRAGDKVPVFILDSRPPYEGGATLLTGGRTTWLEVLELMRRAEDDKAVRGVTLVFQGAGVSWAQAEELRERIQALQSRGKPVIAYLYGSARSGDYFIASAASKIIMHPSQDLWVTGVGTELEYYKGAFDLLGVEPQYVRRREYKSAVEQYTNSEPSPASIEQTDALLDDLSGALTTAIVEGRHKTPEEVKAWIDSAPHNADDALASGMIDAIAYPDQIDEQVEAVIGRSSVNLIGLTDLPQPHSGWKSPSQVAIIYIEGAIVTGRSGAGGGLFGGGGKTAGSDTIVAALEKAADDDQVKAIVLRVDSPGGSSFASDDIYRAVERVQQQGKPVVVSMGGVAASGGYYVACGADSIWAEPTTITGSIGVYSGKYALGGLMERVGVTHSSFERGRNADIDSQVQPWDALQLEKMDALVGHTYDQFKAKVAEGRGMTVEQVDEVARGRVWTGARAKEKGLVDGLGGIHDAIHDARVRAGIADQRDVALVSYRGGGALSEAIAPGQMSISEKAFALAFPALAERLSYQPTVPVVLQRLGEALQPMTLSLEHPSEVWMYDPTVLELDGR